MIVTIQPSILTGTVQAPTSKSSMQRGCAAALLKEGITIIKNPGHSNDDNAAIGVIKDLGAVVETQIDGSLKVTSKGVQPVADEVNCGESGLGIRMFTPIVALSDRKITINGSGSLTTRPMDFFDQVLPQLGITITSNNGKLPMTVKGPLQPRNIEVDGSLSSQFLTGLLMSYAAANASDVTITVNNLTSKPYIDLTLQVMDHFGWHVENKNYKKFYFPRQVVNTSIVGKTLPAGIHGWDGAYTVEGDWSGAAFLLVAGAIAGNIVVKGLDINSTQADKAILDALDSCGAQILEGHDAITMNRGSLKAFDFDANECPDLFPPLVALAACCDGVTTISGAKRLTHKESNRALTLQEEFGKMGIKIELEGDQMHVKGGPITSAHVSSHHDHRIAMACAIAALRGKGPTVIEEAQAVDKSYPDFYEHLMQLGALVGEQSSTYNV